MTEYCGDVCRVSLIRLGRGQLSVLARWVGSSPTHETEHFGSPAVPHDWVINAKALQARNFHQIIGGGARRTESEFYYFTIS